MKSQYNNVDEIYGEENHNIRRYLLHESVVHFWKPSGNLGLISFFTCSKCSSGVVGTLTPENQL